MNRWLLFFGCLLIGLALVVCGLMVPAHLRAVDLSVVRAAGQGTAGLVDRGQHLLQQENLGSARLLLDAANALKLADRESLAAACDRMASEHPAWVVIGSHEPRLEPLARRNPQLIRPEPVTELVIRPENRQQTLNLLRDSRRSPVLALLRLRTHTNTVVFSPSGSSSGQAFDAAIGIAGLLLDHDRLAAPLREALLVLTFEATQGGNSHRIEQSLLDLTSLGQRFNWGQLISFVGRVEDVETLRILANLVREHEARLPVLFATVELSGNPRGVANYLAQFSQTGLDDLEAVLPAGSGGVNELLQRNQRLQSSGPLPSFAVGFAQRQPWASLALKWALYLAGGFLLAAALHYARPAVPALERPLQVRGFHFAREFLFALGFLVVILMLSEPFLAQESQKVEFPFQLRLPMASSAAAAESNNTNSPSSFMNPSSLLTLLLFFVIQGLIYTACRVKLAEIRRQKVLPGIKLKLLDNEDHLFDAGLYLGFVGTIISLILVSLGIIKPSLMAAYSSTSFGIIFVSAFKIFNLRPLRRTLLLEAEAAAAGRPGAPAAATTAFATQP